MAAGWEGCVGCWKKMNPTFGLFWGWGGAARLEESEVVEGFLSFLLLLVILLKMQFHG